MLIGYTRVSKSDGTQLLDRQMNALVEVGVDRDRIFSDRGAGKSDDRPGLAACLKALREGDTLVICKLDRLGRNLKHLVETVHRFDRLGIGLHVLTGVGINMDTRTDHGKQIFGVFAALAEFEHELISERTKAGLEAARKRGRKGGRKFALTPEKVRLAQAALTDPKTEIQALCKALEISKPTLYRYMDSQGKLREAGHKVMRQSGLKGLDEGDEDKLSQNEDG